MTEACRFIHGILMMLPLFLNHLSLSRSPVHRLSLRCKILQTPYQPTLPSLRRLTGLTSKMIICGRGELVNDHKIARCPRKIQAP